MKKYLSINKVSKILDVSAQTLRNWDKAGKLVPTYITDSGYRYYSEEQINLFTKNNINPLPKFTIGYCRVSSKKQLDELKAQVEQVRQYLISQGKPFEIIEDIDSAFNYNRKGLKKLINKIVEGRVEKVVILYQDIILRLGFEILENVFSIYNTSIEIIDNSQKNEQEEIVEDLIQIIKIFSDKMQDSKADETEKIIKKLIKKIKE